MKDLEFENAMSRVKKKTPNFEKAIMLTTQGMDDVRKHLVEMVDNNPDIRAYELVEYVEDIKNPI